MFGIHPHELDDYTPDEVGQLYQYIKRQNDEMNRAARQQRG